MVVEKSARLKTVDHESMDHVDYGALDKAKIAFIEASKRTLKFAKKYGFVPDGKLGGSSNVFSLNLKPYKKLRADDLMITLLPEGLGTADDARPNDLSNEEMKEFWFTIGWKIVSALTNDAAASGMQTVLISLYLPTSTPELIFNEIFMKGFLDGFVSGCQKVGCVYFSGETPQLKTKIYPGKIDVAGALFGIMPPGIPAVDGSQLEAGDIMVMLGSNGPNENGFTTLRDLAIRLPDGYRSKLRDGQQYWKAINNRSHLFTPFIQELFKKGIQPTGIQPITGHGWQKIMRSKKPLRYVIEQMLPVPEIFQFVQKHLNLPPVEMLKIFNYGLGMVIFVKDEKTAKKVVDLAGKHNIPAIRGGRVEKAMQAKERQIVIKPLNAHLSGEGFLLEQ